MTRVYVVVEGQTEESFISNVLAPILWPRQVYLTPIIVGAPGHKGGKVNYARLKKDVLTLLKQDAGSYCSTMVDLYRLGSGFPGVPPAHVLSNVHKVTSIEAAVKADIVSAIPNHRPDVRFVPYVQLHEYEALLFSNPADFAEALGKPVLASKFQAVRQQFLTPEDIDDGPNTAPSKRVLAAYPAYRKVVDGTIAGRAVGVPRMRDECPHFSHWIQQLEAL